MNCEFSTMTFGHWPQGANGALEPIRWNVLTQENDRLLVLADKVLDMQPFDHAAQPVRWENCSLRQWLQEVFLPQAFTKVEREKIFCNPPSEDPAGDLLWQMFGMETATSTVADPVFLLSSADVAQYFPNENTLFCPGASADASDYVQERYGDVIDRNGGTLWWLRSSMSDRPMAYFVSPCDSVGISKIGEGNLQGVRPAMWLKQE